MEQYRKLYKQSVEDPEAFWGEIAKDFFFKEQHTGKFLEYNFDPTKAPVSIKWMQGAKTNLSYNMLDRNIKDKGLGDTIAFFW